MTAYSSWVQGEDVTGTSTSYAGRDLRQTRTTSGDETAYSDGGTDPGFISAALNNERARAEPPGYLSDSISGAAIGAQVLVRVGPTPPTGPPYPFITGVVRDDAGLTMSAASVISSWQAAYAASIPLPPGAAGVELESSTFIATAATVDLPMTDTWINGLSGSYTVTTPLQVDFYVRPGGTAAGSPGRLAQTLTTRSDAGPKAISVTVTAGSADLDPTSGDLIIWPESRPSSSPAWDVGGAGGRDGFWDVGRRLSLDGTPTAAWTLRPPRHRFVYDQPPPSGRPAYNRIMQRGNDGLGASGGRRIVQNRTLQSTNRRGAAIR